MQARIRRCSPSPSRPVVLSGPQMEMVRKSKRGGGARSVLSRGSSVNRPVASSEGSDKVAHVPKDATLRSDLTSPVVIPTQLGAQARVSPFQAAGGSPPVAASPFKQEPQNARLDDLELAFKTLAANMDALLKGQGVDPVVQPEAPARR